LAAGHLMWARSSGGSELCRTVVLILTRLPSGDQRAPQSDGGVIYSSLAPTILRHAKSVQASYADTFWSYRMMSLRLLSSQANDLSTTLRRRLTILCVTCRRAAMQSTYPKRRMSARFAALS
jgi:hypothetical protein